LGLGDDGQFHRVEPSGGPLDRLEVSALARALAVHPLGQRVDGRVESGQVTGDAPSRLEAGCDAHEMTLGGGSDSPVETPSPVVRTRSRVAEYRWRIGLLT
jgi:hypothetical protein